MLKSFIAFLHRFFFTDDDPFKKPVSYEPYQENQTIMETIKPVRKRAVRKKPAAMAVYKKNKNNKKKAA